MTQHTLVLKFQGKLLLPSSGKKRKPHSKFMSRYGAEEAETGAVSKPWAMVAVKDGPLLLPLFMYSCPFLMWINLAPQSWR
jgi:hypothetical protein